MERLNIFFSMAYHHDMDGLSEIKKWTIKVLLKAYHRELELRYQGDRILSKVAYAYFNAIQRPTDKHPFKIIEKQE